MNRKNTLYLANGGLIAALYVVLTVLAAQFNLANGAIQVRFSEALTILPVFTSAAVPGLTIGCVLANLLIGSPVWDVVFGSVATLIGAIGTRLLKNKPLLAWIPPVISNAVIVPIILINFYPDVTDAWWFLALTVGAGELISCGALGLLLWKAMKNVPAIRNMK